MIENIIEQIKKLSEEQIVEFAEKFNQIYEPIKKSIDNSIRKNSMVKTEELGDKICDLLGVDYFPFSRAGKCLDSPYDPYVYVLDCWDSLYLLNYFGVNYLEEAISSEELENEFKKLYNEFISYIPKDIILTKDDIEYQSPNWEVFDIYSRGGNWNREEKEIG